MPLVGVKPDPIRGCRRMAEPEVKEQIGAMR
jgi:hypothetical protein